MKPINIINKLNESVQPLDKEKYFNLMDAVDELIISVNGNKAQLQDVLKDVTEMFDKAINKLTESTTEEYWDATEIRRDGFMALLRFNFGYDSKGNNYIVTIDNNEVCRFVGSSDEYAIGEYEKIKKEKDSGLVNYDFNNHYNKIVEDDFVIDKDIDEPTDLKKLGRCPYCTKKLVANDDWFIKKYGMCQECFENGVE